MAAYVPSSIQYHVLGAYQIQPGRWATQITDFCSAGPAVCFASFFCPCIQFGRNQQKLKDLRYGNGSGCCVCATLYLLLLGIGAFFSFPVCHLVLHLNFRLQVRQLTQIQSCFDCCIILCCSPCAMVQEATQLQLYEDQVLRANNGMHTYSQARVGYGHQAVVPAPTFVSVTTQPAAYNASMNNPYETHPMAEAVLYDPRAKDGNIPIATVVTANAYSV